ncbi:MAG TPA: tetratricopeptide repeat protein, partial [Bryobacteraceae bacterium]|nr:tetratricopeptide repeat protein [Bryobacteraceae bacterium]
LRFLTAAVGLALCIVPGHAADQSQLDASPALFTVLAAINAAGYDADIDSPANHPLREAVRRELAAKNIPCLPELKRFFEEHRRRDWTAELSQYISFGLLVDGPPTFSPRLMRNEMPPDVTALEGFQPLLVRFYREAGIESLWKQAQPAIDAAIARYHAPITRAVTEVSGYLRTDAGGFRGWRFQIYVDLLGAPNQIHTRSYANEYFVVVTPSPSPQTAEVRHAYLHFLLDPLATRYSEELMKKKAVGDYALGAPYLDEAFKEDFLMLANESLIKAVESRLQPGTPAQKQAVVAQALGEGYVLAPHFSEQLARFESQDTGIRLYYPDLISSIDFRKEERRLAGVEFSTTRPVRKAEPSPPRREPEMTPAHRTLEQAERLYGEKQYPKAKEVLLKLMEEPQDRPVEARAFYGLARIAALEKDPELAEKLFLRVLQSSPDPQTEAYSHLYLGRLADLAGETEGAAEHYKAVLAVQGAPSAAREAAGKGLQEGFRKK